MITVDESKPKRDIAGLMGRRTSVPHFYGYLESFQLSDRESPPSIPPPIEQCAVPSPCDMRAVVIACDVGAFSDLTATRRHSDLASHAKMVKTCKSERFTFVAKTKLPSLVSALPGRKQ